MTTEYYTNSLYLEQWIYESKKPRDPDEEEIDLDDDDFGGGYGEGEL